MKASLEVNDRVLIDRGAQGTIAGVVVAVHADSAGPLYAVEVRGGLTYHKRRAQLIKERGPQPICATSDRDALARIK